MNRELFEKWFKEYYAHHLDKEEYSLERFDSHPYQYIQDIAHHDWKVCDCSANYGKIVCSPEEYDTVGCTSGEKCASGEEWWPIHDYYSEGEYQEEMKTLEYGFLEGDVG